MFRMKYQTSVVKGLGRFCRTAHNFPRFVVSQNPSMADQYIDIAIQGLRSEHDVTIHASTRLPQGTEFESFAQYKSDKNGSIQLDQQHSLGGTYVGIDPMGLLWSMIPSSKNQRQHERLIINNPLKPYVVTLRLHDSRMNSLEEIHASGQCSAETSITRWYSAPGVKEYDIKEGQIRAYLFLPPGEGPFPGIISMSGGYPGAMKHKGSLLASHGFATLCLKYFGKDDLPKAMQDKYDLEYFKEAATYLKNHPKVKGEGGIGIIANCYGGTIGLGLAACSPPGVIKCVAVVNSGIRSYGNLSYGGKEYGAEGLTVEVTRKPHNSWKVFYRFPVETDTEAIKRSTFEFYNKKNTSYLFITGGEDDCVPSEQSAEAAKKVFQDCQHPDHHWIHYPKAGHLIEHAYSPFHLIAWTFDKFYYYGGMQPFHERAQEDSWNKILQFVRERMCQD